MKKQDELILHIDGGARGNPGPAAAGVVLRTAQGDALLEAGYLLGKMTNNQAEYSALLLGLQAATRLETQKLTIYSDSELMVRQLTGEYRVKSEQLKPYFEDVQRELLQLDAWAIHHIPRLENQRADELANRALDANEDVVEVRECRGPPTLTRTDRQEPKNLTSRKKANDLDTVRVLVEVINPPARKACSDGCTGGARYVIDDILPAGLHLEIASRVIEAVRTVREQQNRSSAKPGIIDLKCSRCDAVYRLSAADTG